MEPGYKSTCLHVLKSLFLDFYDAVVHPSLETFVNSRSLMSNSLSDIFLHRTGNISDIDEAGSLHEFLVKLHGKFGDLASFYMGTTMAVSISTHELFRQHSKVFDRPCKCQEPASFAQFILNIFLFIYILEFVLPHRDNLPYNCRDSM